jgi:hypothetical protein
VEKKFNADLNQDLQKSLHELQQADVADLYTLRGTSGFQNSLLTKLQQPNVRQNGIQK